MPLSAWALVLSGALCHALWNLAAKQVAGGAPFVWLYGLVSLAGLLPLALWQARDLTWSGPMLLAVLASAGLHSLYSLVLQRGYQRGAFSVVYPLARGSGPLLAVLGAIALLQEWPSAQGWGGIGALIGGIALLSQGGIAPADRARQRAGVGWGLATGACIAAYTVVDGLAIKALAMPPLVFYGFSLLARSLLLAPLAWRQPAQLRRQASQHAGAIVRVGVLSPLAYALVLFALQQAPLSYVAPVREVSMLLATWLGARYLGETLTPARLMGALLMLLGVSLLAGASLSGG
ncbi:hypothetical protein BXU06_03895 [Aquaspirillum sp. LM1]|uniref:EamA family transporter n=1 Tax=Aquaspirillum sp. LM1 TaxID=1938604 RepID=UPI00098403F1|nr:EamA family transporter [Aquaspirillum sp. LM1]AQR64294.1 hypothetical protein BXU06_03895 [Aquaspirillum sp. LM1]